MDLANNNRTQCVYKPNIIFLAGHTCMPPLMPGKLLRSIKTTCPFFFSPLVDSPYIYEGGKKHMELVYFAPLEKRVTTPFLQEVKRCTDFSRPVICQVVSRNAVAKPPSHSITKVKVVSR